MMTTCHNRIAIKPFEKVCYPLARAIELLV